jgi:AraC-like DNA-binding protein
MSVTLDTRLLPRSERRAALNAAIDCETQPTAVVVSDRAMTIGHLFEAWDLSASSSLLKVTGTPFATWRDPRHLRAAAPEAVALWLQMNGNGKSEHLGHRHLLRPGDLAVIDQTSPVSMANEGGQIKAFNLDYTTLGLPIDTVRRAAPTIKRSPIYNLVANHLRALCEEDSFLPPGPARKMVHTATTELMRALVLSALDEGYPGGIVAGDSLFTLFTTYIEQHLGDHAMSAESIARAHNISVRHLYKTWAKNAGVSLSQWVINARLEGARRELAEPGPPSQTIAVIASHWGFVDAPHFSRRFRETYGMSPREWRKANTVDRQPNKGPLPSRPSG